MWPAGEAGARRPRSAGGGPEGALAARAPWLGAIRGRDGSRTSSLWEFGAARPLLVSALPPASGRQRHQLRSLLPPGAIAAPRLSQGVLSRGCNGDASLPAVDGGQWQTWGRATSFFQCTPCPVPCVERRSASLLMAVPRVVNCISWEERAGGAAGCSAGTPWPCGARSVLQRNERRTELQKTVLKYFICQGDLSATICDFKNLRGFSQQYFLG